MYIVYFNALKTLIKSNLNTVETVDWFNNQYTRTEELKAIKYPAVYIEFANPMSWQTGGEKMQYANTSITLHIVYFDVKDSPNIAMSLTNDIHKLIHGQTLIDGTTPVSSSMVRTSSDLVTEYDQLKIIKLTYDCTLYDCSTMTIKNDIAPISLDVKLRS